MNTTAYQEILTKEFTDLKNTLHTIAVEDTRTGDWVAKPDGDIGEADDNVSADIAEDWNERRAILSQLEMRYHNIKKALDKFDAGTYGVCEFCQEEIETDRLDANPAARTCKMHLEQERQLPM